MICTQCNTNKTTSDFYVVRGVLMTICKQCQKDRVKRSRANKASRQDGDKKLAIHAAMTDDQKAMVVAIYRSRLALGLPMITADELEEALGLTPSK